MAPIPDSGYFDGSAFVGVDDDATVDAEALTALLEARIAADHQWLHANGAGAVTRHAVAGSGVLAGYNDIFHTAATWASLIVQPFLVTRGLLSITVELWGTIQDYNTDVRLELVGFGRVDATWTLGSPGDEQVYRSLTLTLPEPSQYEYETDLILWGRSQLTSSAASGYAAASVESGIVTTTPSNFSTVGPMAIALTSADWSGGGFPIQRVLEPVYRNASGKSSSGAIGGIAILDERISGEMRLSETEISRITPRSWAISSVSA